MRQQKKLSGSLIALVDVPADDGSFVGALDFLGRAIRRNADGQQLLAHRRRNARGIDRRKLRSVAALAAIGHQAFIGRNNIALTQEFLSQMLAVRRTSVTFAANTAGVTSRSSISTAFAEGSCECYEAIKLQATRLLVGAAKQART